MLVPSKSMVGLGSAIFAFLVAGRFTTIEEAQEKICPPHRVHSPDRAALPIYDELYTLYSKLYFAFGEPGSGEFGKILPALIRVAESVNQGTNVASR